MSELDHLLESARTASPATRIELRDEIARHGKAAIEAMLGWIADPTLQRFSVRVLGRVADFGERDAALHALASVAQGRGVDSLVGEELRRLRWEPNTVTIRRRREGSLRTGGGGWPWSDQELCVLVAAYFKNEFAAGDDERQENHELAAVFGRTPAAVDRQWRNVADVHTGKDVLHVGSNVIDAVERHLEDPVGRASAARKIAVERGWSIGHLL